MQFLPSRSSWAHAAKLYLPAYIGVVIFTSVFWFCLLSSAIDLLMNEGDFLPFFLVVAIVALIAGFAFYQCLRLVYWLILKVLWSNPPRWLKVTGFRASLHSFSILTVASLPLAIVCYFPMLIDFYAAAQTVDQPIKPNDLTPIAMMWFSWLWFIAAAYLYQWFPLQRLQQKPTVKSV